MRVERAVCMSNWTELFLSRSSEWATSTSAFAEPHAEFGHAPEPDATMHSAWWSVLLAMTVNGLTKLAAA